MKLIIAVIKPFLLEEVLDAIQENPVNGVTFCEIKGRGRQKGHTELYRGAEYVVDYLPKMEVRVIVPDDMEEQVYKGIERTAKTGKFGDGIIYSIPLEGYKRIRTGEDVTDEEY